MDSRALCELAKMEDPSSSSSDYLSTLFHDLNSYNQGLKRV